MHHMYVDSFHCRHGKSLKTKILEATICLFGTMSVQQWVSCTIDRIMVVAFNSKFKDRTKNPSKYEGFKPDNGAY